jgi:hypothetical protein
MLGTYTGMKILVGSHLSFNVIRNKLTPRLGVTIPVIEDEIQYGFARDVPNCQGKHSLSKRSKLSSLINTRQMLTYSNNCR